MATVTIGANTYDVYCDVAYADVYLAADVARWPAWSALTTSGDKERALVSATRLLLRQQWIDGPPSLDNPPEVVKEANALLAADIAVKPALGDSGATGSNVKAVGAGSARVEFFGPTAGTALPSAAFALLSGLLGPGASASDPALDGTAFGSHDFQRSRFDPTDYGLHGDGYPEELGW